MRVAAAPGLRLLLAAAGGAAGCAAAQVMQPDIPYGAPLVQHLSTAGGAQWTATSSASGLVVPATVPGDLVTDLQRAGVIGDPYYELGWLNSTQPWQGYPMWDVGVWAFETSFPTPALQPAYAYALVFDGVKMAADVLLNGVALGVVQDQFLRYVFPLPSGALTPGAGSSNNLTVAFTTSRDPRNAEGRFSGASGGWDWGPYTATGTGVPTVLGDDTGTFSKGMWRDVYLVAVPPGSPAIAHVAPLVWYQGAYPLAPLEDSEAGPWLVSTRVYLDAPPGGGGVSGTLAVAGSWGGSAQADVTLPAGATGQQVVLNMSVPAGAVALWWPNGMGAQAMHAVNVSWTPSGGGGPTVTSARPLGFRTVTVVTADDTHPDALRGVDGSGNLTVRWRVNGANVWLRGADVIPMEVLDGRQSTLAFEAMVASAAAARFNVLRVDGIDLYFPDVFYAACDAYGVLVYHDLQYSQGSPGPANTSLQEAELRHTLRRLAHHPSLAVVDGCNECGGHGVYASFGMTVVAQEDPSRPPWPASPSNGWVSGVDRLMSLPNGSPLGLQPTAVEEGVVEVEDGAAAVTSALLRGGAKAGRPGRRVRRYRGGGHRRGGAHGGDWLDTLTATARAASGAVAAAAAAGRAAAATATTGTTSGNCTFLANVDLCPTDPTCISMPAPRVSDAQACCDACTAAGAAACGAGVFYEGKCWFKPPSQTAWVYSAGRIACWPASRGPPPPTPTPPPPGPMPVPAKRETHEGYTHGTAWPAVNGDPTLQPVPPNMPPALSAMYAMGPSVPGFLVSEFGCVAACSFESLAPTLAPEHWGVHGGGAPDDCPGNFRRNCSSPANPGHPGNVMAQRNYPIDSLVLAYFGAAALPGLDAVGAPALQRQLYMGMVGPALQQKAHIEAFRSAPVWGTLFWQLNEIWPTVGWGSVEYGPSEPLTRGQVVGGRWKPLHYWLAAQLYADVVVAGGDDGRVYVRNDSPLGGVAGTLTLTALSLATGLPVGDGAPLGTAAVDLPPGAASIAWTCMDGDGGGGNPAAGTCTPPPALLEAAGCAGNVTACALRCVLTAADGTTVLAANTQLLAPPSALAVARGVSVTAAVGAPAPDGSRVPVTLTVSGGGAAVLVVLTTQAAGRFSDNALPLLAAGSTTTVDFLPMVPASRVGAGVGPLPPLDAAALAATLRVEHLAMYL